MGNGAAFLVNSGGNDTIYGLKANDTLEIAGANYSTLLNGEDLLVKVGNAEILLKGAAKIAAKIEGTQEGNASKAVMGTAGDDTIANTVSGARIMAQGGNDSVMNTGNRVTIEGGAGEDTLSNEGTNGNLNGGNGDDAITNNAQKVTIQGGAGYDTIKNVGSGVSINGGDGNDFIENDGGEVTLSGGKGADSITSTGDTVLILGGESRDTIFSGGSNVTINANDGEDFIFISEASKMITDKHDSSKENGKFAGMTAEEIKLYRYSVFTVRVMEATFKMIEKSIALNDYDNMVNTMKKCQKIWDELDECDKLMGLADDDDDE